MAESTGVERALAAATLELALHRVGWTAPELARRAGVSRALLHDYLRGRKQPSVVKLASLLRVTGVELRLELTGGSLALTLAEIAELIAATEDDRRRWRLVWEFLRGYREGGPTTRVALVRAAPLLTGDARWDALLGGVAEHLAFHDGLPIPGWCVQPDRFLAQFWFPGAADAEGRSWRMMRAPAALAARGVWVERDDLELSA